MRMVGSRELVGRLKVVEVISTAQTLENEYEFILVWLTLWFDSSPWRQKKRCARRCDTFRRSVGRPVSWGHIASDKSKKVIKGSTHARSLYFHPDSRGVRDKSEDTVQPSPGFSGRGYTAKSITDVRDFGWLIGDIYFQMGSNPGVHVVYFFSSNLRLSFATNLRAVDRALNSAV
jgi:hypothetical protein